MKTIKNILVWLLVAAVFMTVAACGPTGEESKAEGESQTAQESKNESVEESVEESKDEAVYRNLCAHFLDEDTSLVWDDMWTMYDWDTEGKYVTCSHSLECAWGVGYGKSYLFDGVKSSNALMFDVGAYLSCTVKPGWGATSGEIDDSTVTWKKKDLDEWMKIDLQGIFTIDKINFSTLYSGSDHGMPAAFTISVSTDGENWTEVINETNYLQDITSVDQTFTFDAIEARYVYFHFTKGTKSIDNNLAYCVGLTEIEIWGK